MLDVLLASAPSSGIRPNWLTASVLTHSALIATAVVGTRAALNAPPVVTADPSILLFVPKPAPPPPPVIPDEAPKLVLTEAPAKGFQTVTITDIPDVIPPIDLKERPLDPRDFTGRGMEGGLASGVAGATATVDVFETGGDAIYEATLIDERFAPAVLISEPAPTYPPQLQELGITGRALMEFVIDTTGHVEPASIRKLESTHQAFDEAARATITAAVFRPAHLSSRPVRQLTRQSIRFVAK
jgi:TonB family protein